MNLYLKAALTQTVGLGFTQSVGYAPDWSTITMSHSVKIYDTCIGCTQCVRACPTDVLEMVPWDGCKAAQIASSPRTEDCIGCKRCETACPTDFLSVRVYLGPETSRSMALAYQHVVSTRLMQLFIFCIIYCKGVPHRTPLLFWGSDRACIVTTKDSGHHETITLFQIEAIPCRMRTAAHFLADFGDAPIQNMASRIIYIAVQPAIAESINLVCIMPKILICRDLRISWQAIKQPYEKYFVGDDMN